MRLSALSATLLIVCSVARTSTPAMEGINATSGSREIPSQIPPATIKAGLVSGTQEAEEVGLNNCVASFAVYNGKLIAGGYFTLADGVGVNYIAHWDAPSWLPLGSGVNNMVHSFTVYNGDLITGGFLGHVIRWDGSTWQWVGLGLHDWVHSLTVYNGELIVGGEFTNAGEGTMYRIARWDGSEWQSLGTGMNGGVRSLTVYNSELIAGGGFTTAGGVAADRIARWDGATWQPLGSGMNASVYSLTVYNGNLIAGGYFTTAGGVVADRIARWDGSEWQPLGAGMNKEVRSLTVYNSELIAGGAFWTAGGVAADNIARWDGSAWQPLGSGMNSTVFSLTVYNGELIAGGCFTTAGGVPSNYAARWIGWKWQSFDFGNMLTAFEIEGESSQQNVANHSPTLSWEYTDYTGFVQSEFEIAVGSDDEWSVAEMWEPGVIQSSDTSAVYTGLPLLDGETYFLRLRIGDGSVWSNWYKTFFRMNSLPSIPSQLSPIQDALTGGTPVLYVSNSVDSEADALSYQYELWSDEEPDDFFIIDATIPGQADSTGWAWGVILFENTRHLWRCRAFDGYEYSDWSAFEGFWVNHTEQGPSTPQTAYPVSPGDSLLYELLQTFSWTESTDSDPFDTVRYKMELSYDENFTFVRTDDSLPTTSFPMPDSLQFGTAYWWRVTAFDRTGLYSDVSEPSHFWTWTLGDVDHSHSTTVADIAAIVDHLFGSGAAIVPVFVGDVDGDCDITVSDIAGIIDHLFGSGADLGVGCE